MTDPTTVPRAYIEDKEDLEFSVTPGKFLGTSGRWYVSYRQGCVEIYMLLVLGIGVAVLVNYCSNP